MLDSSLLKLFFISSIYCNSWRHSCWCESTPNPSQSLTWGIIFLLSLKKKKRKKKNPLFALNFATSHFLELLLVLELWFTVANNASEVAVSEMQDTAPEGSPKGSTSPLLLISLKWNNKARQQEGKPQVCISQSDTEQSWTSWLLSCI